MMNANKILVTGAAGRTGVATVDGLLSQGIPVRAMVRQKDKRSDYLEHLGAEVVVGDFNEYNSLVAALQGIEAAYWCYPVAEGIAEAAGYFAAAGKETALKRVVQLSIAAADPDNKSPHGKAQWVAEQILDWAGFDTIHLRVAAFFMENLFLHGPSVQQAGLIRNPFGGFPASWITGDDVGAMAASLLANPAQAKEKILFPTGIENYTYAQIAAIIAMEISSPVYYTVVSPEEWRNDLNKIVEAGYMNSRAVNHLISQSIALRNNPARPTNDLVEKLTGRKPERVKMFIRKHRARFMKNVAVI
jgi:uncharacterized protein YbjT (DUF2867 family)